MLVVTEEAVTMKIGVVGVATRVVIMAAVVIMEGAEEIGITMMQMHIMAEVVVAEILTEGKKRLGILFYRNECILPVKRKIVICICIFEQA